MKLNREGMTFVNRILAVVLSLGLSMPAQVFALETPKIGNVPAVATNLATDLLATGARSEIRAAEVRIGFDNTEKYFTNTAVSYFIDDLLAHQLEIIPDEVINTIRETLQKHVNAKRLKGFEVHDFAASEIQIHVTHNYGEANATVHRLIFDAMVEGLEKAKALHLLSDIAAQLSTRKVAEALRPVPLDDSKIERGAESVNIGKFVGATIGAANIKLFHQFAIPGATPLQKLGLKKSWGFRFRVKRTQDILNGILNGPEWEFEISKDQWDETGTVITRRGINEDTQLLALASQPNDYQITAVYPVEGGALPSDEPIASVSYQPVFKTNGEAVLNPTIIYRSQSGGDAVGGIASIASDVNFVPGGRNGDFYVATIPATLEEARRRPPAGFAYQVMYGYQSRNDGQIPPEGVRDHVALNPQAYNPERNEAKFLASFMSSDTETQPYLSPGAAERLVEPVREAQDHLFITAPSDSETDPFLVSVNEKIASGSLISITDDKADMGGRWGHTNVPEMLVAIYRATLMEAMEKGIVTYGNTFGFAGQHTRVGNVENVGVGDDGHLLMVGDKSANGAEAHQLSFLAFTRAYLFGGKSEGKGPDGKDRGKKYYGLGQDFQGPEAKAAKSNPFYYSHLTSRFFELLRQVMPQNEIDLGVIETIESQWREWQEKGAQEEALPEPFSGNVSQQGIGSARYSLPLAEKTFDVIAADKLGPAALNQLIRHTVYNALEAGIFPKGLVFEIWDLKAAELVEGAAVKDLPTKRIFLDAEKDREAIIRYLAHSDRFNVKHVWDKKQSGWDINNPAQYVDRPLVGASVTRLGILTGGEYVGKDDPVIVGNTKLLEFAYEFLKNHSFIEQGDMNGSHWEHVIPSNLQFAVATVRSHPVIVGLRYTLSKDGKRLARVRDITGTKAFDKARDRALEFNKQFNEAQLGQFEPHGTNARTVEGSYELAKILKDLNRPNSPFLVKNKQKAQLEGSRTWPVSASNIVDKLYDVVLSNNTRSEARSVAEPAVQVEKQAAVTTLPSLSVDLKSQIQSTLSNLAAFIDANPDLRNTIEERQGYAFTAEKGTLFDPELLLSQNDQAGYLAIALAIRLLEGEAPIAAPVVDPKTNTIDPAMVKMLNEANQFLISQNKKPIVFSSPDDDEPFTVDKAIQYLKAQGVRELHAVVGTNSSIATALLKLVPKSHIISQTQLNSLLGLNAQLAQFADELKKYYALAKSA